MSNPGGRPCQAKRDGPFFFELSSSSSCFLCSFSLLVFLLVARVPAIDVLPLPPALVPAPDPLKGEIKRPQARLRNRSKARDRKRYEGPIRGAKTQHPEDRHPRRWGPFPAATPEIPDTEPALPTVFAFEIHIKRQPPLWPRRECLTLKPHVPAATFRSPRLRERKEHANNFFSELFSGPNPHPTPRRGLVSSLNPATTELPEIWRSSP